MGRSVRRPTYPRASCSHGSACPERRDIAITVGQRHRGTSGECSCWNDILLPAAATALSSMVGAATPTSKVLVVGLKAKEVGLRISAELLRNHINASSSFRAGRAHSIQLRPPHPERAQYNEELVLGQTPVGVIHRGPPASHSALARCPWHDHVGSLISHVPTDEDSTPYNPHRSRPIWTIPSLHGDY
jgi:hypothetical protein